MFGTCTENPHNVKFVCANFQNGRRTEILHGGHMHDRIRELREARGWSMRELAQRTNSSASTINSLEKGKTQMTVPWLQRLAKAFDVSIVELVSGSPDYVAPEDDISPLDESPAQDFHVKLKPNQRLYKVQAAVLDQIGIFVGSVIIVNTAPTAVRNLKTGDIVIGEYFDGTKRTMRIRQFIEPALLITNSSGHNEPSISLWNESFRIDGLVVSSVSHFQHESESTEAA